jgi:methylmalonyl-CoA mutase
MATRMTAVSTNISINKILDILKIMSFDSIILETAGIGQGDIEISYFADVIIYVMTSEYGSSLQLEKIAILDYANYIVLNKADKVGAKDAFLDIQRTYRNIHKNFSTNSLQLPVFFTNTRHLNNPEINRLFYSIFKYLKAKQFKEYLWVAPLYVNHLSLLYSSNYLKYTVDIVRNYKKNIRNSLKNVVLVNSYYNIIKNNYFSMNSKILKVIYKNYQNLLNSVNKKDKKIIQNYLSLKQKYSVDKQYYKVRNNKIVIKNYIKTISDLKIPKVIVPEFSNWDNIVSFFKTENLPGFFPYTSGVFPFKRESETTTRMFAGEGMPERTNKRFHYLSQNQSFARLSTAFDSVTLYGSNPSDQLDIYGKIGNSGVSVCSLDDMKRLYSGFDLCNPNTSVSMTINGPAVILLGFFLNTAVDFECERYLRKKGQWKYADTKIKKWFLRNNLPKIEYRYALPPSHNSLGLGFLGLSSDNIVTKKIYNKIKKYVFQNIRGTMQADIFKEDQAQNTCIFSIEFSLRLMADIQKFFINKDVKNFYSVSLSGYHIAEAGANPLTQLAFTLSNGFTLAEYYISSGLHINKFVKNFSFFFSNGLDIEYNVIGRVARRIWAISMKYLYNVDSRGQKLKYHIQTSGRSLHTKDIDFNDIRTTLQAYTAIADNCNSLHTNAYDEALTTPTEESVRRAIAIQLIINKEFGFAGSQNSLQGSYIIEWLTNKVEERVLDIFTALSERNGVLGAMDLLYQRNKIQEESMKYEYYKYTGKSSIVGINTFINKQKVEVKGQIIRSSNLEKKLQVKQVKILNSRMSNLQKN